MLKQSLAHGARTLVVAIVCVAAVPATASAATLWVSNNAPSAPFNSCEHPGYDHIEAAISGPGTAIHVCGGMYAEQLSIQRPVTITGYEGATVELPAVTANSSTPCDQESEAASKAPDQDEISICGAYKVSIKNLSIGAIWPGEPVGSGVSCGYNLNGILVAGGAQLELSGSIVKGAAPSTINGCQYGVGIQVGMSYTKALGVGKAKLSRDTVNGYQKNGVTIEGKGSEATIKELTVTGAGEIAALAQNGIGVQEGATATITGSHISGDECENASCGSEALTQYASDGVYFYDAGAESSVSKSSFTGNDVGVEAFDATATPLIKGNTLEGNRWAAVEISQGSATVTGNTMRKSEVGIQLVQFAGYNLGGTASHDKIEEMTKWAVLGRSDKSAEDLAATFSISASKISHNPGPKPQESVESENPAKLKIYAEKDS